MSSVISAPSQPLRLHLIGAAFNGLGTLIVIVACFLRIAYIDSMNFGPLAISIYEPQILNATFFDVLLLYGTIFFEVILFLAWVFVLVTRKSPLMLTSLAMIITLTGIGLSVVVLGTTLLSEANIILAPGFWLLAAGYSLALTGVLLLRAGSFELVPKSFSSILLVVSLASGVVAATHAGAPQFLRCSGQGDGSSGALIFSADANNLMALHLSDGGRAWACSYFNHAISPLATTRDMFIGVSGTSIFALRMADGALRWQHATDLCAELLRSQSTTWRSMLIPCFSSSDVSRPTSVLVAVISPDT